jgi:hypothetical protein
MEWILQVVDEIDDAFGAVKHHWFGVRTEFGMLFVAGRFVNHGRRKIP